MSSERRESSVCTAISSVKEESKARMQGFCEACHSNDHLEVDTYDKAVDVDGRALLLRAKDCSADRQER